jgi:hypothetical protein
MKLTIKSSEILAFMDKIQKAKAADYAKNYSNLEVPLYVCERGDKYIAIDVMTHPSSPNYKGRSVFCFIAAEDSNTKSLGAVKMGDVLKAAGYKAPVRHARGNIFNTDGGEAGVSLWGARYL